VLARMSGRRWPVRAAMTIQMLAALPPSPPPDHDPQGAARSRRALARAPRRQAALRVLPRRERLADASLAAGGLARGHARRRCPLPLCALASIGQVREAVLCHPRLVELPSCAPDLRWSPALCVRNAATVPRCAPRLSGGATCSSRRCGTPMAGRRRRSGGECMGNGRLWVVRRPLRDGRYATRRLGRHGQKDGLAAECCARREGGAYQSPRSDPSGGGNPWLAWRVRRGGATPWPSPGDAPSWEDSARRPDSARP
jgi:hypothetical protein